ncbi:MAG TPA: hypothetical protein PLY93_11040, partial [Turneriella sp.]|nr:hypothetical protein [Turneriella sp.]
PTGTSSRRVQGRRVADVGELSSPARTGGKYHTGAKALEAPQKEEVNFSFGYKGISNYLLQFNINARAYRKLFEVRYQDGSQVSTTASTAGAGVPVYNVIASGNETYTLTNMDKNAYYTHFEIAVLQLPSASNWIFHGSIGGYFGAGYSPQGLAAFYNDVGVYNESTADPNFRENRFGRLDNDRGYMGKIVFGYRFLKTLSVVNVLRYRDGEPMVKDRLVTGLAQGPIVVPITERGGGLSGVGRHTYSLAWDLRLRYDAALWGNTVWAFLDVYNLLNSRTELAEYPLEGTAFRDPVEQGIERTVRLGLGMQF